MDAIEAIRANAALVIENFGPISGLANFGLNVESVAWLDDYIARSRAMLTDDKNEKLVLILVSFFGECVIARYGGAWVMHDGSLVVRVNARLTFFPYNKLLKHIQNEDGDSILSAFEVIGIIKDPDIPLVD